MLLTGLVAVAFGDIAAVSVSTCGAPAFLGSLPADGDVGLPADTVLTLVFEDASACSDPELEVRMRRREPGPDLELSVVDEGDGTVRVVPSEPLADGRYVAEVTASFEDPFEIEFTVGGDEPTLAPGEPADLVLSAGRSCDQVMVSRVALEARFPSGSDLERGLLKGSVLTEDGEQATMSALYLGEPAVTLEAEVFGGRELCVVLSLEDVTGAVVWELEPVCAEDHPGCTFDDEDDERDGSGGLFGFGCSSSPIGGLLLLPFVVLATRRRGLAATALLAGCSGPHHHDDKVDTGFVPFTTTVTVDLDGAAETTDPVDTDVADTGDTAAPIDPSVFVPTDLTVPPAALAGERTWCWTMAERYYQTHLFAVGADSGTVVEVDSWPGHGGIAPPTALAAYDGRLVGARHVLWFEADLLTGSYTGGPMDDVYEPGLAVIGTELVAISSADELRVYPNPWELVRGYEIGLRPGFDLLANFTADGPNLIGTDAAAENLLVVDATTGAVVSTLPLEVRGRQVGGLSMGDGLLHLLEPGSPARIHRIDPATGADVSTVELVGAVEPFLPGGLWCEPH